MHRSTLQKRSESDFISMGKNRKKKKRNLNNLNKAMTIVIRSLEPVVFLCTVSVIRVFFFLFLICFYCICEHLVRRKGAKR